MEGSCKKEAVQKRAVRLLLRQVLAMEVEANSHLSTEEHLAQLVRKPDIERAISQAGYWLKRKPYIQDRNRRVRHRTRSECRNYRNQTGAAAHLQAASS